MLGIETVNYVSSQSSEEILRLTEKTAEQEQHKN